MTAGQIATPYRQVRISLFIAALAVTFGVGLVTGLVAQRTVGLGAQTAANPGGVAVATGSGTWADRLALHFAKRDLQAAAAVGAVNKPSAFVAAQAADQVAVRSAITADGQDIQLGTRFGSATLPVAAGPVVIRSAISADGQDIKLGALASTATRQAIHLAARFGGP
ncbi:MAG: hypothetical protein ACLQHS_15505 [Candidatus Limnocylindrales bacterium]